MTALEQAEQAQAPTMDPNGSTAMHIDSAIATDRVAKAGSLPQHDLASSVVVTTYNRTPYFYEQIEPKLTPESRFPTDKLKLQVVFEQEEEEEVFQPRPQKV